MTQRITNLNVRITEILDLIPERLQFKASTLLTALVHEARREGADAAAAIYRGEVREQVRELCGK
jgi:hypothetical protein